MIKEALKINPLSDSAYIELGRIYEEIGLYEESGEMFRKSIELNPDLSGVLLREVFGKQ